MRMHRSIVTTVLACLLLLTIRRPSEGADPTPSDRERLVGTWRITVFQDDGRDRLERIGVPKKQRPNEKPRVALLVFTKDACHVLRGDGKREKLAGLANIAWKSCTLDATTKPKSIDLVGFAGKDGSRTKDYLGIYRLDEDTLTICWCEQGKTRPTKLESDGAMNLVVARRVSKEPTPIP